MKRWFPTLMMIVFVGVLLSGWRTVEPGEVVVLRRFGRVQAEPWGPGAHWAWPIGIDRLSRLRLDEVRRLEFGRIDPSGPLDAPGSGEFLTGDRNIVRARGVVQYRVIDPVAFLLGSESFDATFARITEASLARALASRPIDAPLRDGRAEVACDVQQALGRSVETLGLGVTILGVNLTDARPPIEVEPAFAEAQSALSERDRRLNEARSLAGQLRPAAVSLAENLSNGARIDANRKATMARAEADRFLRLLDEANRSRALTIRTLYRDTLRDLLPKVRRKVLMTPDEPVDLGLFGK
jgi:membrane protease subunit HflK